MTSDADTLAALDFTPAPMQCSDCDRRAQTRVSLTCGCLTCGCHAFVCSLHAMHLDYGASAGALVCHVHRLHGVQIQQMGEVR